MMRRKSGREFKIEGCIPVAHGFIYLAAVLDEFLRRALGLEGI